MNLDAGASKEAPFLIEADAPSDSPTEAPAAYVYPPHLDGLRTHGDEVDVDSILAVAELEWPTSTFVVVIGFCFLALGIILSGFATESMSFYQFLGLPLAFVLTITMVKATVGIMINRGYYAKGPEWDTSLGPKPKPRSSAFVLTATLLFCLGTFAAYLYLKGVRPGVPLEPALTDLLVLLPWTYAGAIVIDGYWVPYYKRKLGLL